MAAPLWAEAHRPNSEAALVVAKRKVADVREFLTGGPATGRRLLVLRGPPGSGKAAVLRGVCADLGFEVVEWSPATSGPSKVQREPLSDSFLRFFAQTDRYRTLESEGAPEQALLRRAPRPRVTLVRDFPFTLVDAPGGGGSSSSDDAVARRERFLERFRATLNGGAVQRAVLCFNDAREDHRAVTRLLQDVNPAAVTMIHFEAVARTFVQKALDAVALAEGVDPVAAGTAAISVECGGDLRCAFNALQLASGHARSCGGGASGAAALKAGRGRPRGRGRGRGREGATATDAESAPADSAHAAASGLRSAQMGIFKSLGRLLYSKRVPPPGDVPGPGGVDASAAKRPRRAGAGSAPLEPKQLPPELLIPKATRPPLYFVPEEVMDSSGQEPDKLVDWVFTNAPRFYGDVGDLAEFAAGLASADAWPGSRLPRANESVGHSIDGLAASVQVRSLLDANLHPVMPTFGDPCGAPPRSGITASPAALAFNMVRPLMMDVEKIRDMRTEELNAHLEAVGLQALGAGSSGPQLLLVTLPFVDQLLRATRGQHRTLRCLPHSLMKLVQDLNAGVDSDLLRAPAGRDEGGPRSQPSSQAVAAAVASWNVPLMDDPIES